MKFKLLIFLLFSFLPICRAQQPDLIFNRSHTNYIERVIFSPDSRWILSAANNGNIKLWETKTGKLLRTYQTEDSEIEALVFSADARFFFVGGWNSTARQIETTTGKVVRTFPHGDYIGALDLSPDGSRLISAGWDNKIKMWDLETGRLLRTFSGHSEYIRAAAFSPDGKQIVSASRDKSLKIWDTETGELLRTMTGHTSFAFQAVYSPDGRLIASGSYDKTVRIWEAASGRLLRSIRGHTDRISSVKFFPDGQSVLSVSADKTLKISNVKTGALLRAIRAEDSSPTADISADGRLIVSAGGVSLKIVEAKTGKVSLALPDSYTSCDDFDISPDNNYLLWAGVKSIKITDLKSGKEAGRMAQGDNYRSIDFLSNKKDFVSTDGFGKIKIWDFENRQFLRELKGHTGTMNSVCLSKNANYLATGSDNKLVKLWDTDTGKLLFTLSGHEDRVYLTALSHDGLFLASASFDAAIKVWSTQTGKLLYTLNLHNRYPSELLFSPDNKHLISSSTENGTIIVKRESGEVVSKAKAIFSMGGVLLSPSGSMLLIPSSMGAQVSGKEKNFSLPENYRSTFRFFPNEKIILSGDHSGVFKFWSSKDGRLLVTLILLGNEPDAAQVIFAPDGRYDGNPAGLDYFHCVRDLEIVDCEDNKHKNTPGLLREILEKAQSE